MYLVGKNSVYEALRANKAVTKIFLLKGAKEQGYEHILNLAKKLNIKIEYLLRDELSALAVTENHQGIIALAENFKYSTVDDILALAQKKGEDPFVVILDGIEDPHNLGSIIRVCECAGVHGIILPKHRSCTVNETVVKVSAGAIEHLLLAKVTNLNSIIEELKKKNIFVYALELGGEHIYTSNLKGAICLVVGSEGFGVSALTKKLCDSVVTLPVHGMVNSLNASVACGVAVYEILRQRQT